MALLKLLNSNKYLFNQIPKCQNCKWYREIYHNFREQCVNPKLIVVGSMHIDNARGNTDRYYNSTGEICDQFGSYYESKD